MAAAADAFADNDVCLSFREYGYGCSKKYTFVSYRLYGYNSDNLIAGQRWRKKSAINMNAAYHNNTQASGFTFFKK